MYYLPLQSEEDRGNQFIQPSFQSEPMKVVLPVLWHNALSVSTFKNPNISEHRDPFHNYNSIN
jgi:hypothetical protein